MNTVSEKELLDFINSSIEDEYGNSISVDDPIAGSGIDSFGVTMVLLEVNQKYPIWNSDEFGDIDFLHITPKDILGMIEKLPEDKWEGCIRSNEKIVDG